VYKRNTFGAPCPPLGTRFGFIETDDWNEYLPICQHSKDSFEEKKDPPKNALEGL
jgi:hypothetical protein